MVNTTFWSTSKEFKVAERFMKKDSWRNSYIICKALKNNIDIDFENLSPFDEKEVLFLPFTKFRIEKMYELKKSQKKIYVIEVSEIENRNFVNYDNMQIENVNSVNIKDYIEQNLLKNK